MLGPESCREGKFSPSGRLLYGFTPFLLAATEKRGAVFGENPALPYQGIQSFRVTQSVFFAAGIAFGDRPPRISRFLSVGRGFWERQIGQFERDAFLRSSDRRVAQIPTGVGSERNGDFRQAYAVALVAVRVHLGHQRRVKRADLWRLNQQNSLMPVRAEIEPIARCRFARLVHAGNFRERVAPQGDER